MNDLVGPAIVGAHDTHRMFDANLRYWGIHQVEEERHRRSLLASFPGKPSRPTDGGMSAWRMSYHQIPARAEHLSHIADYVIAGLVAR